MTVDDQPDIGFDEMNTQSEVLEELQRRGYDRSLRIDEDGVVRADTSSDGEDAEIAIEQITVDHTVRFEGASNPDDLAVILAVSIAEGGQGTIVLPYGPDVSGPQADAVRQLSI